MYYYSVQQDTYFLHYNASKAVRNEDDRSVHLILFLTFPIKPIKKDSCLIVHVRNSFAEGNCGVVAV